MPNSDNISPQDGNSNGLERQMLDDLMGRTESEAPGAQGGKDVTASDTGGDDADDDASETTSWEDTYSVSGNGDNYSGGDVDDLFTLGEDARNAGGGVNWIDATQADLVGNDWTILIGETTVDPNQSGSIESDNMSGQILGSDGMIATFDDIDKIEW